MSAEREVIQAASAVERVADEALMMLRNAGSTNLGVGYDLSEAVAGFKRVADLMELRQVEQRAEALVNERRKPGRERSFGGFIDEAPDAEYDAVIERLLNRRAELLDALWPGMYPDPVVDAEVVDDPPGPPAPPQPPDDRPVA